jgi:opacity protein-like surface antigen
METIGLTGIRMVRRLLMVMVGCAGVAGMAAAQTVVDGRGGAASLWAGAEYASYKAGFPIDSSVQLSGIGAFATYNLNRHYAVEMHARFLNLNSWNGETEQDYLAGPRYTFLRGEKLRPFAMFQVGYVKIQYPFQMGTGTSFAMAPGGGVEYRLGRKWSVRGAYELQMLTNSPDFTNEPHFGIRPNGATVGISYRVFSGK